MQKEREVSAPRELTSAQALKDVRRAEEQLSEARANFDSAIVRAKEESRASYAQIAEAARLTRSGVQAVLRRSESKLSQEN